MPKTLLAATAVAMSIGLASGAQAKFGDVTTSTDPAKAAEVEQHAQALKDREMHANHHAATHTTKHHAKPVAHSHPAATKAAPKG